jgi:hypothetical protein
MDWLNLIVLALQFLLITAAYLAWQWIKQLPASLHKQQEQLFQHELNRKLEGLKISLSKDLELLKISQTELQVRKTQEFINFGNLQREFLTDKALLKKLESGDNKVVQKIKKEMLDLATGLFFFASDKTVRKYGDWKMGTIKGELTGIDLLRNFGELMVALRKDLGQTDTKLTGDDFLRLFLTDWPKYEEYSS